MKISMVDPTTDNRWDDFVVRQKNSTIFHTAAWARVIREAYNYSPRYYVLEDGTGQLSASMPLYHIRSTFTGNRLICLPFSDYCYPIGDETGIALLLGQVKNEIEAGKASFLEIRGWPDGLPGAQLNLERHNYHLSYILDLKTDTSLLNENFHHSVRRGIRQAENRGVVVRITRDESDLNIFYNLHVVTRKKLGVLPQPRVFFKALYRHVISQDLGFIGLAESEGRVIGGAVFLNYKDTVYYKFNASDENFLQKRPNHLLIWEAVRYACANKYQYFDFGRCSLENKGLQAFKSRWGTHEVDLPYYYYPRANGITAISENSTIYRAMYLFSHLAPKFAFKAAGMLLYKHLG